MLDILPSYDITTSQTFANVKVEMKLRKNIIYDPLYSLWIVKCGEERKIKTYTIFTHLDSIKIHEDGQNSLRCTLYVYYNEWHYRYTTRKIKKKYIPNYLKSHLVSQDTVSNSFGPDYISFIYAFEDTFIIENDDITHAFFTKFKFPSQDSEYPELERIRIINGIKNKYVLREIST